ncbi:MAG TPA: prepilin-type N-terminal cleavage/methylation domain-containing protein [Chthoniobacteraceae bacterium]|nr:prepilin-type N-terminal cleavage/methylation domain-containing protein [Chthoniobacteraceae bacterium]
MVSPSSVDGGFSLVELLVAVALLCLLAFFGVPALQSFRARMHGAECVNRLRQTGTILHAFLGENQSRLTLLVAGGNDYKARQKLWYNQLAGHAGLSEGDSQAVFACPLNHATVTARYCYGFRRAGKPGVGTVNPDGGTYYTLNTLQVARPAGYFIAADSAMTERLQTWRIHPTQFAADGGAVYLGHRGRANVLFLDGHVEALDAEGLYEKTDIRVALGPEYEPLTLPLP